MLYIRVGGSRRRRLCVCLSRDLVKILRVKNTFIIFISTLACSIYTEREKRQQRKKSRTRHIDNQT